MSSALAILIACNQVPTYIVEGTVVEVRPPTEVVIDHHDIPGLMPAMIMPFDVADPALLEGVRPGALVVGRLEVAQSGLRLVKLRVTGQGPPPTPVAPVDDDGPLRPGAHLPRFQVPVQDGSIWTIGGEEPQLPTAVAFVYTRCPMPQACPATVARLGALQAALAGKPARILAVTIDPDHDQLPVLAQYAAEVGADPAIWQFGRLDGLPLQHLALRSALRVIGNEGSTAIDHGLRLLVLGADGALIERYDDNRWPIERVAGQLLTGGPPAPAGSDGTLTP
jgi:protein SCO1/2